MAVPVVGGRVIKHLAPTFPEAHLTLAQAKKDIVVNGKK